MQRILAAMILLLPVAAGAADRDAPNTLLQVGGGIHTLVHVRGEAWVGDDVSLGLGVGSTLDDGVQQIAPELAIHWRPDFACLGCGTSNQLLAGVGIAAWIYPFNEPLLLVPGGSADLTFVHWVNSSWGISVSARGGLGAEIRDLTGDPDVSLGSWGHGFIGLAF